MGRVREAWQDIFQGKRIGGLDEHEGHGRTKQDNICGFVLRQEFAFEISRLK